MIAAIIAAVLAILLIVRSLAPLGCEITDLGYIRGYGCATAINNEGHVVGYTDPPDPTARPTAFIWSPEKGRRSIPALEGKKESRAYDINNKGQILATVRTGAIGEQTVILTPKGESKIKDE